MKKGVLLLSLITGLGLCAAEQPAAQTVQPAAVQTAAPAKTAPAAVQTAAPAKAEKEEPGIAFCLARGVCNIATGWLEIPRCMVYDNTLMPVFGLIVGIPEGTFFTIGREFCGVFDILSFGTTGSAMHGKVFPDTIFQSNWVPPKK